MYRRSRRERSADLAIGELDVPMYSIDAVLRRSPALQETVIALRAAEGGRAVTEFILNTWGALPSYIRSTFWILVVTVAVILSVAFTTLWERKVIGWMQLRKGPNRVGSIFGLVPGIFQPFADVIKLLLKEVVVPSASNKWLSALRLRLR